MSEVQNLISVVLKGAEDILGEEETGCPIHFLVQYSVTAGSGKKKGDADLTAA